MYVMKVNITISVPEEQRKFLEVNNLSPSSMIQEEIVRLMKTKPEEYQEDIKKYEKGKKHGETKWQRAYGACKTDEQREEIMREFNKAIRGSK